MFAYAYVKVKVRLMPSKPFLKRIGNGETQHSSDSSCNTTTWDASKHSLYVLPSMKFSLLFLEQQQKA